MVLVTSSPQKPAQGRLIRDGENGGKGVWRWGERESIYTYRYTVTTRMTCIKMGSDESHFNVSLIVRDNLKSQDRVPVSAVTNHNF